MKKYQESLIQALKNPEEAAAYLNAVLEEGDRKLFLLALKNVAEAHGGIGPLSKKAKLNRAHLYKLFSAHGNPEIHTLSHILKLFGLRLAVSAHSTRFKKAA